MRKHPCIQGAIFGAIFFFIVSILIGDPLIETLELTLVTFVLSLAIMYSLNML